MTVRKVPETKKKVGRKTDFKPEYIELGYNYVLLGAIDQELAEFFGVLERTLNSWKKKFPEFLQSIKKGKVQADGEVVSKLYNRAIGLTFDEVTIEKKGRKIVSKKTTTKHIPADTNAAKFWLTNRQPEKWRNKQDVDLKADLEGTVPIKEWLKAKGKPKKD